MWNRESPNVQDGENDAQNGADGVGVRKLALASITANQRINPDPESWRFLSRLSAPLDTSRELAPVFSYPPEELVAELQDDVEAVRKISP